MQANLMFHFTMKISGFEWETMESVQRFRRAETININGISKETERYNRYEENVIDKCLIGTQK